MAAKRVKKSKRVSKTVESFVHPDADGRRMPLTKLKLLPENPRRNDKASVSLATALKYHRQRTPIVVWKKTNEILKGNTTYKAMTLLKSKDILVSFQTFKNRRDAVDYALSDNRSSEWAEWDEDILAELMEQRAELPAEQIEAATGFEKHEIDGLRKRFQEPESPEEFPEVDENIETEHRCPKCGYEWSGKVK